MSFSIDIVQIEVAPREIDISADFTKWLTDLQCKLIYQSPSASPKVEEAPYAYGL
jgi:hypothetical protein